MTDKLNKKGRKMKLKVFGGLSIDRRSGKQVRTIVATTSQRSAATLVGIHVSVMRDYWSVTGNALELAVALASPSVVFIASDQMEKDFKPRMRKKT